MKLINIINIGIIGACLATQSCVSRDKPEEFPKQPAIFTDLKWLREYKNMNPEPPPENKNDEVIYYPK